MGKMMKTSMLASALFVGYYLYTDEDIREDSYRIMKRVRRKMMKKFM